jgi:hypothetical protein
MDKSQILQALKENTGNTSLQLPAAIQMEANNQIVEIQLPASCVSANMQDDSAAFEGWILGVKAIIPDLKFQLHWDESMNPKKEKHYQRFLYRVEKFNRLFGGENGWFKIGEQNSLGRLKIRQEGHYCLNSPSQQPAARINNSRQSPENLLENDLVRTQPAKLLNLFQIPKGLLQRQLPMGVFENVVSRKTAIFTGGKSAADLWAKSEDGSLILFELKADGNCKMGVLSELFFYAMVLADEQQNTFFRQGPEGVIIRSTKSLKAMILAPTIHPLITQEIFALLNTNRMGIEFGYVSINPTSPFECKRMF